MVQRKVRGDTEEPPARALVVADPREVLPGAQERLLGEIVSRLLVSGHAPQIGKDVTFVRAEERLELTDLSSRERTPFRGERCRCLSWLTVPNHQQQATPESISRRYAGCCLHPPAFHIFLSAPAPHTLWASRPFPHEYTTNTHDAK